MAKKYSNLLNVYHALLGALTKYYKNNMKNMSTTLEIPEGSKATIQGKVIDGKNYLVVEVEQEPEWTKFKRGDVLIYSKGMDVIFVIFGEYRNGHSRHYFNCLVNSVDDGNNGGNMPSWAIDSTKL